MPKNLLIFSDGTGQEGGLRPDQRLSNIYKLFRSTRTGPDSPIDPEKQLAFYDPGLGTTNDAGVVHLKWWDRIKAWGQLVAGMGLSANVTDCYEAILQMYEPGDRIFLFGFSRGAYTIRSLAGVLNLCGIPTVGLDGQPLVKSGKKLRQVAEYAVRKVYDHGAGRSRKAYQAEREELGRRFRHKFGVLGDQDRADVHPYFIGAFDAVASLGVDPLFRATLVAAWLLAAFVVSTGAALIITRFVTWSYWEVVTAALLSLALIAGLTLVRSTLKIMTGFPNPNSVRWHFARWRKKHYDGYLDPRISVVRHALSIDESRRDFPRVPWGSKQNIRDNDPGEPEAFQQIWFAGNHSDVGGSYPEVESRLSDIALGWMVEQAMSTAHPILTDPSKLNLFPNSTGPQHCEILQFRDSMPAWWPARICWAAQTREIPEEAILHPSVYERFAAHDVQQCGRLQPYRPTSLQQHRRLRSHYPESPGLSAEPR